MKNTANPYFVAVLREVILRLSDGLVASDGRDIELVRRLKDAPTDPEVSPLSGDLEGEDRARRFRRARVLVAKSDASASSRVDGLARAVREVMEKQSPAGDPGETRLPNPLADLMDAIASAAGVTPSQLLGQEPVDGDETGRIGEVLSRIVAALGNKEEEE